MTAQSAFKTMTRVRIKHIPKPLYFLCLDPRGDNCGIFVDDFGTTEVYPMSFVEEAPKTVEEIAQSALDHYYESQNTGIFWCNVDGLRPVLYAIIVAAIEEAMESA